MIYVGTCGFSYKDWIGPFYPGGIKAVDMLEYYAEHFPAVEIDSTYYAIPKPALFEGMARRTPPDFVFSVKVPGSITHVPADAQPSAEDVDAFHECLAPLLHSKKLAAVLAQFPNSFRPTREGLARLDLLRRSWPDIPLVAEFRHRDWQRDAVLRRLRERNIGWCNVDEPKLESLMHPSSETTSAIGYVRFHGQNAAKWWKQERSPAERYDYLYSPEQIAQWLPRIAEVSEKAHTTLVFFNNHRNGQAAVNAGQLAEMLGLGKPQIGDKTTSRQLSLLDENRPVHRG